MQQIRKITFFAVLISGLLVLNTQAKVLVSARNAFRVLVPEATETKTEVKVLTEEQKKTIEVAAGIKFNPELDKEFIFYIGWHEEKIVGYAAEDRSKGKWGVIHYLIVFNTNGSIRDFAVLEYGEKRGRPVAKERFRKQFRGMTIHDRMKLRKDIHGVSGATISSTGMTNGVRKMTHVFHELYIKNNQALTGGTK